MMHEKRSSSVLVRDGERLGIFTNTGLQRAVVDGRPLEDAAGARDDQFRSRHDRAGCAAVRRARVDDPATGASIGGRRGDEIVGLLEQLDLLSFLSNHSYLITVRIVQASDLDALRAEAEGITRFVALLYRGGTRAGQIGRLVQALNAKLFERTWQLLAPAELRGGQLPVRDGQ